jgi:hypothetical protein
MEDCYAALTIRQRVGRERVSRLNYNVAGTLPDVCEGIG